MINSPKTCGGGEGGGGVEFSKESYSLNWLGKSYASVLRNDPPTTWIKPDNAFNSTHPNSQNFLIKGDNLEALKLLKNAYEKKIKMIYIDPPYNTGNNDFVYKDDRKYTPKELSSLCGMSEEECKKMLEYYSKGKNSHSAWLTFMYPRLSLARNLLKEDGVIFISIDDNEQAQLKLLCDEIFGEENFVGTFCVENNPKGRKNSSYISLTNDYCLVYAKSKEVGGFRENIPKHSKELEVDEHNRVFSHGRRVLVGESSNKQAEFNSPKHYSVYYKKQTSEMQIFVEKNLDDKRLELINQGYVRYISCRDEKFLENTYTQAKFLELFNDGALIFKENTIYEKDFNTHTRIKSILTNMKYMSVSKNGEFEVVFDYKTETAGRKLSRMGIPFDMPKNVSFLKTLITLIDEDDFTILDFFAGSGTTAQAVMELNAEDNGNRRFILVQLPESIDEKKSKTAYDFVKNTLGKDEPKISDITQERIIRASKQIREKHPEYQGDLGFQVFELEEIPSELAEIRQSNFEKINHLFANEDIDKMLDIEAILQSFCLYDSIPLGAELEKVDLGGYIAYKFQERIYLLHQGFQTKHLQEFLRKMDDEESFCVGEIVLLAYCFESARRREIAEAISYYNKKSRELKIVVRG